MMQRKKLKCFVPFVLAAGIVLAGCDMSQKEQDTSALQETETDESNQEEIPAQKSENIEADQEENDGDTGENQELADDDKGSSGENTSEDTDSHAAAPSVTIETESRDWYSDDGEQWLMQAECDSISVSGNDYDALCRAVSQWDEEETESFWNYCENLSEDAASCIDEETVEPDSYYYESRRKIEVSRVDESVLSLVIMNYDYLGGAHGYDGYTAATFDAASGDILMLEDLLADAGGFRETAEAYILEKLEENYSDGLFEGYEDTVAAMWDAEPVWYLDSEGITFVFNAYELGPYAMGEAVVTCPYEEFGSYIKDVYSDMS